MAILPQKILKKKIRTLLYKVFGNLYLLKN